MHDLIPLPTAAELAASMARHPAGKRRDYPETHVPLCEHSEAVIEQSHTIDDQQKELARYKRANREAMDLLTLALHALDGGSLTVVNEYLERSVDLLWKASTP